MEFTKRGLERLEAIRKLEQSYGKLTNQQILARTDALATEVRDILANDLVPVDGDDKGDKRGPPIDRDDAEQDDRGDPTATTTTPVAPEPNPSEAPAPPPPTETAPPTQADPAPPPSPDPVPTTTTAAP